jgi:hypothetical protein
VAGEAEGAVWGFVFDKLYYGHIVEDQEPAAATTTITANNNGDEDLRTRNCFFRVRAAGRSVPVGRQTALCGLCNRGGNFCPVRVVGLADNV